MLSIPHMLTGAFVASKLPHPLLYVPITLAFHYFQDWTPHWDVGTGLSTGKRKRSTALLLEFADLGIAIGSVYFLFHTQANQWPYHIWIAAFVGILPDLIEAPRNFLKWEPPFFGPLNDFHNLFHHSTHNIFVGLLPQVATVLAIFWLR